MDYHLPFFLTNENYVFTVWIALLEKLTSESQNIKLTVLKCTIR